MLQLTLELSYKSTDKLKRKYCEMAITLNKTQIVIVLLGDNLVFFFISLQFHAGVIKPLGSFKCIIRPLFCLYIQFYFPKKKMK